MWGLLRLLTLKVWKPEWQKCEEHWEDQIHPGSGTSGRAFGDGNTDTVRQCKVAPKSSLCLQQNPCLTDNSRCHSSAAESILVALLRKCCDFLLLQWPFSHFIRHIKTLPTETGSPCPEACLQCLFSTLSLCFTLYMLQVCSQLRLSPRSVSVSLPHWKDPWEQSDVHFLNY